MLNVACLQLDPPAPGPAAARTRAVADQVRARRDADLVVLPELWPVGYFAFDAYERSAEPVPGEALDRLRDAAVDAQAHVVAGSVVERGPEGRLHNTSVLIGPSGDLLGRYRKIHVFGHGSDEPRLIAAGDRLEVVKTEIGTIGLSICYDLRFPELYRALVARGAEILLVVAAWPRARTGHWAILTRARALENQAWLIACGAAGVDRGHELAGRSVVVSPTGVVVAEAGEDAAELDCEIDVAAASAYRREFPALADRQPSLHGDEIACASAATTSTH